MVRRVRRKVRAKQGSCSYLSHTTRSRGMIAVAIIKRIESRVVDRGFRLQTGRAVKVFSCGEADEREF